MKVLAFSTWTLYLTVSVVFRGEGQLQDFVFNSETVIKSIMNIISKILYKNVAF